jgi:putative FmdB family regulatory protein
LSSLQEWFFGSLPGGGTDMPMYDYKCLDCGKESLVVLTLKEHESSKVTCPKCGSAKMRQLYTSFVAHTTKKS